ncbi:TPA: hypothetical protein ACQ53E_005176 [Klebsiella pneumoniae]
MRKNSIINAMWMMSEKVITLFGLFFVTSFVAKYIGPSRFGQLALAIAIFQVVQVVAQLGCDNIIFKRVSQNATSGLKLIYSSFAIRAAIYIFIAFIVLAFFYKDTDFINFVFFVVCVYCLFFYINGCIYYIQ